MDNPCGKTIYADKRAAETARNQRMQSRHNRPDHLRIYPCRSCDGWHLATSRYQRHPLPDLHRSRYSRARINRRNVSDD